VATYPDGAKSAPFAYDVLERSAIDAVVVVAFERRRGDRAVYVRSATRAPLVLRAGIGEGNTWEVPAGMIDAGEEPRAAAARELLEETGFDVAPGALLELGPSTWPNPATIAERQYFYWVDVTGVERGVPTEDGSALEKDAQVIAVPLADLLAECRAGRLHDAKTELALRRFAELA
jgi:ADP-ribose pyrophosphatase